MSCCRRNWGSACHEWDADRLPVKFLGRPGRLAEPITSLEVLHHLEVLGHAIGLPALGEMFPLIARVHLLPEPVAYPQYLLESLVGCPLYVSAYGCVARPTGLDLPAMCRQFSLDPCLRSQWAEQMDELLRRTEARFGHGLAVSSFACEG